MAQAAAITGEDPPEPEKDKNDAPPAYFYCLFLFFFFCFFFVFWNALPVLGLLNNLQLFHIYIYLCVLPSLRSYGL